MAASTSLTVHPCIVSPSANTNQRMIPQSNSSAPLTSLGNLSSYASFQAHHLGAASLHRQNALLSRNPNVSKCCTSAALELEPDSGRSLTATSPSSIEPSRHHERSNPPRKEKGKEAAGLIVRFIADVTSGAKERIISGIVDLLFKPSREVNIQFEGNFAPVPEIGRRVPVKVIAGSIPADFPVGVYIRNGPNPQFGADCMVSPFGTASFHWFEGDGMLHATYFGPEGQVAYQNKFVETEGYKLEKERNKRLWLNTVEGDSKAVALGYFFNQIRFGKVNKATCNTSVFQHAGRLFVGAEGDLPHQINPSDLSTIRVWDWDGEWGRPFTSHPKLIRDTNELVVFGFATMKPYYMTGVISADGERFVHKCDLELDKCIFSHEVAITEQYNLILDWPLVVDVERLKKGGKLIAFEAHTIARVGIMPRFGDASTVQWFDVEMNYTFHIINSYEDGDEVVLQGCRARVSLLPAKPGMDRMEWFGRAFTPTKIEDAKDPNIDGALFTHAHEWRFNLKTGIVVERDLTDDTFSMDMPKINDKFVGYKYKYAYANVLDLEASVATTMLKYGKIVKLKLDERIEGNYVKLEFYDPGPQRYVSEPLFVSSPNAIEEDDGWIVTYVHDENTNISELHILNAKALKGEPLARIQLPQRVPYGFHSAFIQGIN